MRPLGRVRPPPKALLGLSYQKQEKHLGKAFSQAWTRLRVEDVRMCEGVAMGSSGYTERALAVLVRPAWETEESDDELTPSMSFSTSPTLFLSVNLCTSFTAHTALSQSSADLKTI